jgi:hypothetical protein
VFMVPECHQANEIALYRAEEFPRRWKREATLLEGIPATDVSVIKKSGLWWMFFSIVGPNARDQRELHVAHAPALTGPWQLHSQNPIRNDRGGARPAGTPIVTSDGALILPVQDCSLTYGGAVRFLWFTELSPECIGFVPLGPRVDGNTFSPTHVDGCHTLSACGNLTLVDTKRTVRHWGRHRINLVRYLHLVMPVFTL